MKQQVALGLALTLLSSFLFAASGPVAKAMYAVGWTPGAVVLLRLLGCAFVLAVPTVVAMRGRWGAVRAHWRIVVVYGVVAIVGVQLLYFLAVEHLTVAVALLLEMTAPLMIVFWVWMRTGSRPAPATFAGMVTAMLGLVLILDPRGAELHLGAVLLALGAAVCLCAYFLIGAKADIDIPPVALTGLGMGVGAGVMLALWPTGILEYSFTSVPVDLGGAEVPWWVAVGLLAAATAGAYLTGVMGLRMIGATVSSFVNLTEVPFSVLVAWLVLSELPGYVQLVGGVFIIAGVVFIKLGESRVPVREVVVDEVTAAEDALTEDASSGAGPRAAGDAASPELRAVDG
ncbi:DMT family transporter [Brevibacterium sp. CS2]|uniref:DMT family transporter n=1 Tax=Brevibacterium sp. CS2 TaxID=2575923 RepID=UPI0020C77EBF|nr:EamA family transporter [Brevibacterium sp. CS2]